MHPMGRPLNENISTQPCQQQLAVLLHPNHQPPKLHADSISHTGHLFDIACPATAASTVCCAGATAKSSAHITAHSTHHTPHITADSFVTRTGHRCHTQHAFLHTCSSWACAAHSELLTQSCSDLSSPQPQQQCQLLLLPQLLPPCPLG